MNDIYYYTNSKGEVVEATYSQVEEASKHFGYPDAQTYMTDKGITTDPPAKSKNHLCFLEKKPKMLLIKVKMSKRKYSKKEMKPEKKI